VGGVEVGEGGPERKTTVWNCSQSAPRLVNDFVDLFNERLCHAISVRANNAGVLIFNVASTGF
jgi:hypothetical protein